MRNDLSREKAVLLSKLGHVIKCYMTQLENATNIPDNFRGSMGAAFFIMYWSTQSLVAAKLPYGGDDLGTMDRQIKAERYSHSYRTDPKHAYRNQYEHGGGC
ncbi:hypothetical protein LTR86_008132 [Recurvomyces mirabilis]|nr:hypothetical protein LTR86_008132 [Recurvomyces mirabilis]